MSSSTPTYGLANDRATAEVLPASDGEPTTQFVREEGDWKIAADFSDEDSSTTSSGGQADDRTTAEPEAPQLQVADRGFSRTETGAIYGIVVKNATGQDAVGVEVQVNLLDDGGGVLATTNHTLSGLPAGDEAGVGGEADTNNDLVSRLEVTVTADSGAEAGTVRLPSVSRVKVDQGEFGLSVRAEVRNTLDEPLSSITDVFAVVRNANGEIVGGLSGFPESDLPPGGRAAVELGGLNDVPGAVDASVTVDGETG